MKKPAEILNNRIAGIDYGNKYSGTTVICYNVYHQVRFIESSRNADADAFILTELNHLKPDLVMIDAPLTLPGIYNAGNGFDDYFYRRCDKDLKAMSPMFLGGLTARAIKLKEELGRNKVKVIETYPRKLVQSLNLPIDLYKRSNKDLPVFTDLLMSRLGVNINVLQISSWHRLDAVQTSSIDINRKWIC